MGGAILFVSGLAGLIIVSFVFVLYLCHCLMQVLEDTCGGIDEVRWPDEMLLDWWWKPLYCVATLVFAAVVSAVVLTPCLAGGSVLFTIVYGLLLWLAYPVCLLSPLAANNVFMVVDPVLVWQLARHPRALALVYFVTLPAAGLAVGLIAAVFLQSLLWAFLAALVLPAAVLFYARAWGRLCWLVVNERRRQRKEPSSVPARSAALAVEDPWQVEDEVPELDVEVLPEEPPPTAIQDTGRRPVLPDLATGIQEIEDEWSLHKKPYALTDEETHRKEPPSEAYGLTPAPPPGPMPAEGEIAREMREREEHLRKRAEARNRLTWAPERKAPTFRRALGTKLFAFLIYGPTVKAWVNLAALTLVELLFAYLVAAFVPPL